MSTLKEDGGSVEVSSVANGIQLKFKDKYGEVKTFKFLKKAAQELAFDITAEAKKLP